MRARFRLLLWPLLFVVLAGGLYRVRIQPEMADFDVYRTAATRALHAEPLYRESDGHFQLKYLPAFALAMTPFALLDREVAKAIWFTLSVGLLIAFVRWSVRALPERRRPERMLFWLTGLFMLKFYAHELTLGQANILLGTLLFGGLLATQAGQLAAAGVLIGVAAFIKPYALVLLPWLALSYGAAAPWSVAVLVVGMVLPAILYGWAGNIDLLTEWFYTVSGSTAPSLLGSDNVSIIAMGAKWLGPGAAATALATIATVAVLGLVAVAWVRRKSVANPDYLECALLMLIIPLLSPQGWDYVLLLGTPAVVYLLDRWSDVSPPWQVATGLCLAVMGLTVFDVMGRQLYRQFMALSPVTVAAIGSAVALLHLRWRALG